MRCAQAFKPEFLAALEALVARPPKEVQLWTELRALLHMLNRGLGTEARWGGRAGGGSCGTSPLAAGLLGRAMRACGVCAACSSLRGPSQH